MKNRVFGHELRKRTYRTANAALKYTREDTRDDIDGLCIAVELGVDTVGICV
jgi:hypothetical protein